MAGSTASDYPPSSPALRLPQLDPEATAFAVSGFYAHGASHALDGFLHDRQSDPGARIASGFGQTFEDAEDSFLVFRGDADAIVAETEPDARRAVLRPNADLRSHTAGNKFQ